MTARDIYPIELIRLAKELVEPIGPGHPQTIRLRRGVSTAYYALFHRLSRDVAWQLLGAFQTSQAHDLTRWLDHKDLRELASQFNNPSERLKPVIVSPTPRMAAFCSAFVRLQDARQQADYNHEYDVTSADARALVRLAQRSVDGAVRMRRNKDASYERFLRLAVGALKIAKQR